MSRTPSPAARSITSSRIRTLPRDAVRHVEIGSASAQFDGSLRKRSPWCRPTSLVAVDQNFLLRSTAASSRRGDFIRYLEAIMKVREFGFKKRRAARGLSFLDD